MGRCFTGSLEREAGAARRIRSQADVSLVSHVSPAGSGRRHRCVALTKAFGEALKARTIVSAAKPAAVVKVVAEGIGRQEEAKTSQKSEGLLARRSTQACDCDAEPFAATVWSNLLRMRGGYRESDVIRHYVLIMTPAPEGVEEDELRQAVEVLARTMLCAACVHAGRVSKLVSP